MYSIPDQIQDNRLAPDPSGWIDWLSKLFRFGKITFHKDWIIKRWINIFIGSGSSGAIIWSGKAFEIALNCCASGDMRISSAILAGVESSLLPEYWYIHSLGKWCRGLHFNPENMRVLFFWRCFLPLKSALKSSFDIPWNPFDAVGNATWVSR